MHACQYYSAVLNMPLLTVLLRYSVDLLNIYSNEMHVQMMKEDSSMHFPLRQTRKVKSKGTARSGSASMVVVVVGARDGKVGMEIVSLCCVECVHIYRPSFAFMITLFQL